MHMAIEVDLVQRPSLPAYPYVYDIAKQLHQIASKQGHYEYGAFWAGSNVCPDSTAKCC